MSNKEKAITIGAALDAREKTKKAAVDKSLTCIIQRTLPQCCCCGFRTKMARKLSLIGVANLYGQMNVQENT